MIGNNKIFTLFQNLIDSNAVGHGYLFYGQRNLGKFSFSRCIAHAFEARTSLSIAAEGIFTKSETQLVLQDTLIINDAKIGIDAIRNMKEFLSLRPMRGMRRVVIIDNADMLSQDAQHALLRVSEDAPASSLIILVSAYPGVLLDTVTSRFVSVFFRGSTSAEILSGLIARGATDKQAEDIVAYAGSMPARAVNYFYNPEELKRRKMLMARILKASLGDLYQLAESMGRDEVVDFFEILVEILRRGNRQKTLPALREALRREEAIKSANVNVRLQLEAAINAYVLVEKPAH